MPKIDTLDALEEHEEHDDDYQTITNWNANWYTNLYTKWYTIWYTKSNESIKSITWNKLNMKNHHSEPGS